MTTEEKIKELREQGKSIAEIARIMGLPIYYVRDVLED